MLSLKLGVLLMPRPQIGEGKFPASVARAEALHLLREEGGIELHQPHGARLDGRQQRPAIPVSKFRVHG